MKKLLVRKSDHRVISISDGNIKYDEDKFELLDEYFTSQELLDIDAGDRVFHKGKKKIEKQKHKSTDLEKRIKNAKSMGDLKTILLDIIN